MYTKFVLYKGGNMNCNLTEQQKEELEKIGELYRKTIYDSSIVHLPDIVKGFSSGLTEINGDISSNIVGEVLRFHKLVSSHYTPQMRKRIDGLHRTLCKELSKEVFFTIVCRQKAWESFLRKILKNHLEGSSIVLSDPIALRVVIDSMLSEEEQKVICHQISDICIDFFVKKQKCRLLPPLKRVANNPLLKDYIDYPKNNGYQSIHLAFIDLNNNIFEIQIRTKAMDADAEYGPEYTNISNEDDLNHEAYKDDEYKEIKPYIYFDATLANRPLFRTYYRMNRVTKENELIISDSIGLKDAKHIEKRARTF